MDCGPILCQYSDQVLKVSRIHGTGKWSLNSFSLHITLRQNIDLYLVINPPFIYSPDWQKLLEQHVLQMPLEIMDLMVVSKFHTYQDSHHSEPLLEFLMDHEGAAENVVVSEDPPAFVDFASAYAGPLIYVSLFARYGVKSYQHAVEAIEALESGLEPPESTKEDRGILHHVDWAFAKNPNVVQNQQGTISKQAEDMFTYKAPPPKIHGIHHPRKLASIEPRTNVMAVDARQYTHELGECSTEEFKTVSTCITDTEHDRYDQGHRCFGSRGGHADLISYDLIEAIHELLLRAG